MKHHIGILLQGMAVIAPVGLTLWLVYFVVAWVDRAAEAMLGDPAFWVPGLGLLLALGIVYLVGILTRLYLFRSAIAFAENAIGRVPLLKTLYASVRDLLKFFRADERRTMGKAVRIDLGPDAHMLGVVTTEDPASQRVGVYLPLSYQIGGFLVYMPPERLRRLDMSVETALKLIMTGGVGAEADTSGKTIETEIPEVPPDARCR